MKQIILGLGCLILNGTLYAQEKITVQPGNRLEYSATVQGRTFPVFFLVDSLHENNITLTWNYEDGRTGRFIITKSSIDSATSGYYDQPIPGEEVILPKNKELLFFSKLVYSTLQKTGKAQFDEGTVTVKTHAADKLYKLQGRIIDALYLESDSGARIWMLNNPACPLVLKIENNPFGVDAELTGIN